MLLFFDTETTGFVSKNCALNDPRQPHLVQLGAILTTETGRVVGEMNLIVAPADWIIPEDVAKIHGMDQDLALQYGFGEHAVFKTFCAMCNKAKRLIAHNIPYDLSILRIAHARYGSDEQYEKLEHFCTMEASTPICKLPGRYGNYKWPKMVEAYKHFFGREFEGAHDAMADIRACRDVYFKLLETSNGS
jgi:DNA polymerase-3 subunit epsilon